MRIELLKKSEVSDGSQFFEFLPGKYDGKCWKEESVYLEELVMGFFEGVVKRVLPSYSHFAFQYLDAPATRTLAEDLKGIGTAIQEAREPKVYIQSLADQNDSVHPDMNPFLSEGSEQAGLKLASLAKQLAEWLETEAVKYGGVSILGL